MTAGDPRSTAAWQHLAATIRQQQPLTCWRCGQPINPTLRHPHPQSFQLGHIIKLEHRPDLALDPTNLAPEHRRCNIEAENHQRQRQQQRPNTGRNWT